MKWQALPGPANFIDGVIKQLRDGISVVVAAPSFSPHDLENTFVERLAHDQSYLQRVTIHSSEDPLIWLTERLSLEPKQWVGWSVEKFLNQLSNGRVIAIDGVTESNWEVWRTFLRAFEVASRQRASDERPVLLLFVRGVPKKNIQASGVALTASIWTDVIGELDTLIYVDQRLRKNCKPARHHKLIVRQIAALALWDFDLADYLVDQPVRDVFDIPAILQSARNKLGWNTNSLENSWENGRSSQFDGLEMLHPFVLVDNSDPNGELQRRVWAAQAAELLPLIEVRRRELIKDLERKVPCPLWINGDRAVHSLDELEIGSLAHIVRTRGLVGEIRNRAEWLAQCRNTLAHLGSLNGLEALDSRLYG